MKMRKSLKGMSGHGAWFVALACVSGTVSPAGASSPRTEPIRITAQGRDWNSIKQLPDWSGTWMLTDESWTEAVAARVGASKNAVPFAPAYLAKLVAHPVAENEYTCIPVGIPESAGIPIGHEYLFTPGRVTIIFENGIVRRIDTSGHQHPSDNELTPSFAGNSIGHWEGNTLVVDTIALLPQAEFLIAMRVTEKTHLSERILRKDADTLQIDTVISDPEIFTSPYSYTRYYKHSTLGPFEYYPCSENNRDTMVNGDQTGVNLTPPPENKP